MKTGDQVHKRDPDERQVMKGIFYPVLRAMCTVLLVLATLPAAFSILTPARDNGVARPGQAGKAMAGAPEERVIRAEGRLAPSQILNLSFGASGQVEQVLVEEGEMVQAGEVLALLGGDEQISSSLATAKLELLDARHARDELQENAAVDLARAEKQLALARWEQAFLAGKLEHLRRGPSQLHIDQARANMRLAQNSLEKAQEDLRKAEKKWRNKKSEIWYFVGRHEYKEMMDLLRKGITLAAVRLDRATEKYEDLVEPLDEIDLAVAEADLAVARARLDQAQRERDAHLDGPDPDDLAAAEARIQSAEDGLRAAQAAQRDIELVAPIPAMVAQINIVAGEWAEAGHAVMILIDPTVWVVETTDVTEMEAPHINVDQKIRVRLPAIRALSLTGTVERIDGLYSQNVGDILYTVRIRLNENDPRFRWGMTTELTFDQEPD